MVRTTLNQSGQVFIAIRFRFEFGVKSFERVSKMGNGYPLLLQFLRSLRICLDKQRSECYITKWLCLSRRWCPCWNWTGGVAFFRVFGAGDVVALTEEGSRIGASGAGVSLRRTRTGFPLDACLRVSNRSGYALTNVN